MEHRVNMKYVSIVFGIQIMGFGPDSFCHAPTGRRGWITYHQVLLLLIERGSKEEPVATCWNKRTESRKIAVLFWFFCFTC